MAGDIWITDEVHWVVNNSLFNWVNDFLINRIEDAQAVADLQEIWDETSSSSMQAISRRLPGLPSSRRFAMSLSLTLRTACPVMIGPDIATRFVSSRRWRQPTRPGAEVRESGIRPARANWAIVCGLPGGRWPDLA
jgi:hypothetical protein